MTSAALLEMLISLSVQAGLIVVVTALMVRLGGRHVRGDLLWFCGHLAIFAIVLAAFTLPHLRLLVATPYLLDRSSHLMPSRLMSASIVTVWFAGVLYAFAQIVVGTTRLYVANRISDAAPDAIYGRIDQTKIGAQPIHVFVSQKLGGPFCWQIHRPTIALPQFILNWPSNAIDSIIRHEIVHLQSGHPMHLFCQRMIECFFWFHPLVWFGSRSAVAHREFHCDAACIADRGDAVGYLRSLLRLAETSNSLSTDLVTAAEFIGEASLVQQRANRIIGLNHDTIAQSAPAMAKNVFAAFVLTILLSAALTTSIWIPLDPSVSRRSVWSPWPHTSAAVLHTLGIAVTDYEIDGHRMRQHGQH